MTLYPLITRDPVAGEELVVTRLQAPRSGITIEGRFSLGWVGKLTPEQLDFVGLLLRHRNNLQRLAGELGVAYNTARARLDEIVAVLGGEDDEGAPDGGRREILDLLARRQITLDDALERLRHLRER